MVLAVVAPTAALPDTLLLILDHTGHTGSHALCEALGKMSCMSADCSEPEFSLARVKRFRESSPTPYALLVYRLHDHELGQLGGEARLGHVRFLPQIRLDLMRWALSLYCKKGGPHGGLLQNCFEAHHDPQFEAGQGTPLSFLVHPNTYRLPILSNVARVCVGNWRDYARMYYSRAAVATFVFYEDLLAAESADQLEAYARWILASFRPRDVAACSLGSGGGAAVVHDKHVVKVHSDEISTFVKNADEVRAHFLGATYPSFMQIASDSSNPWGGIAAHLRRWTAEQGPPSLPPRLPPLAPPHLPPPPARPSPHELSPPAAHDVTAAAGPPPPRPMRPVASPVPLAPPPARNQSDAFTAIAQTRSSGAELSAAATDGAPASHQVGIASYAAWALTVALSAVAVLYVARRIAPHDTSRVEAKRYDNDVSASDDEEEEEGKSGKRGTSCRGGKQGRGAKLGRIVRRMYRTKRGHRSQQVPTTSEECDGQQLEALEHVHVLSYQVSSQRVA
jgi:hypothetical protein